MEPGIISVLYLYATIKLKPVCITSATAPPGFGLEPFFGPLTPTHNSIRKYYYYY